MQAYTFLLISSIGVKIVIYNYGIKWMKLNDMNEYEFTRQNYKI